MDDLDGLPDVTDPCEPDTHCCEHTEEPITEEF